jgi:hypothetical protein
LSELADYRKIKGLQCSFTTARNPSWVIGSRNKGAITGCTMKKKSQITLPAFKIENLGFE